MQTITLISTLHEEKGNCNAVEMCKIIEKLSPEIVFLEALEDTYKAYDAQRFISYGVYHEKLEIKALQYYSQNTSFDYVPVLDDGLTDAFDNKFNLVCINHEYQTLIENYNSLAICNGFKFLNSIESMNLQDEMRNFESLYFKGSEIEIEFNKSIDIYENTMIANIYSYCKENYFNTAIFLCGVAHRKSIIEKIQKIQPTEKTKVNWQFFEE
jgi:hypothetical protein